jgi:cellobiose-specific phosphotransferase system component IIB
MASQFSGNNWLAITDIKSNFTGRTKYFILKHMSKKQVSEALEQFNVKELIGPMSMMLLNEKIQELDQKDNIEWKNFVQYPRPRHWIIETGATTTFGETYYLLYHRFTKLQMDQKLTKKDKELENFKDTPLKLIGPLDRKEIQQIIRRLGEKAIWKIYGKYYEGRR